MRPKAEGLAAGVTLLFYELNIYLFNVKSCSTSADVAWLTFLLEQSLMLDWQLSLPLSVLPDDLSMYYSYYRSIDVCDSMSF